MTEKIDFKDAAARPQIIAALASVNVPGEFRAQITDLAFHAADEAVDAMIRVIGAAPDSRVAQTACGIAVSLLQSRAELMRQSFEAMAASEGKSVRHVDISLGANGPAA